MSEAVAIPVFADQTVAPAAAPVAKPVPAEGVPSAQDTGDQAPPASPEAKPEVVTPEVAAKREGRRFGRKLDAANKKFYEQQARADLLEKRLAELEKPKAPEGEPKLEDFDYDPEKYATAKAEHAKSQTEKEFKAKQRTEAGNQERQRLIAGWEEKVARADTKYEDFDEKVGSLQPNNPLLAAIMEADNGEEIAYYLGNNPKEAERIARLQPLSQVREIGKLEAKLLLEPVKPKTPSSAPEPIKPVGGSSSPSTKKLSEMTQDEFDKRRRVQIAARR